MSNRLGGKQGMAYLGTNANQPPNWFFNTRDPDQYDSQNYSLGDLWLNTLTTAAFMLVSLQGNDTSKGALALWQPFVFGARIGFSADITASIPNATGNGTLFTIPFDRTYYNVRSAFDISTGIFTAPLSGIYQFNTGVTVGNLTSAMVEMIVEITISGSGPCVGDWSMWRGNPYVIQDGNAGLVRGGGGLSVVMSSGDTAEVNVRVRGGVADSATVSYGAVATTTTPARTWFNGYYLSYI